jgi:type I restriction enzyme S subunit
MASEWPLTKVGDLATSVSETHRFGKDKLVFLNTSDVLWGDWPGQAKKSIRKDDILFSEIRPANGRWAYVDVEADDYVVSTKLMVIRARPDRVLPRFLYYFLTSSETTSWLQHLAESRSGTFPQITFDQIAELELAVPPVTVQEAIARFLDSIDEKRKLNRRMNSTLASIAQALFNHLFPYSTDDDLPDGWRIGRLDELLVLQRGFDLPSSERSVGPYPVLAASGPSGTHARFMVHGPGVTTGRSGVLGKVYFVHEDFWPLNTSLWIREFRHATPSYAFYVLRSLDFELFNAGSAVPTLNRNHVHNLPVVIPPTKTVQEFDRAVMPLLSRQKTNQEEIQTLAALRNTLLPKLLSGEVRVN